MTHHKYLIIGGGMAADAATAGIREVDHEGSIGLVGAESDPPYNRPALSKALWKDQPLETIWRDTAARGVRLHLGHAATAIDPRTRTVTDTAGNRYRYEKLLLATGGTPRHLGFGGDDVIYYQTTQDYRRLRELSANKRDFAIIGGGFIGSEVAAALAMHDRQVTMVAKVPDRRYRQRAYRQSAAKPSHRWDAVNASLQARAPHPCGRTPPDAKASPHALPECV
jgi:3-phenylpropionate/trans-cinnamate dioxygenase ferredoxin reductase subunit